jgi:nucleoside diphosphate kinase
MSPQTELPADAGEVGVGCRNRTRARTATPGTIRGDYALESGTTSCMVPAYLRQPTGNQDLFLELVHPFRACR